MAAVSNAFGALLGAGEAVSAKKKNKNKQQQQAPAPAAKQEAPAKQERPVSAAAPAKAEANGAARPATGVVEVTEATAILERAAREAKAIGDKTRLWKDWVRQVRRAVVRDLAPCLAWVHAQLD